MSRAADLYHAHLVEAHAALKSGRPVDAVSHLTIAQRAARRLPVARPGSNEARAFVDRALVWARAATLIGAPRA